MNSTTERTTVLPEPPSWLDLEGLPGAVEMRERSERVMAEGLELLDRLMPLALQIRLVWRGFAEVAAPIPSQGETDDTLGQVTGSELVYQLASYITTLFAFSVGEGPNSPFTSLSWGPFTERFGLLEIDYDD